METFILLINIISSEIDGRPFCEEIENTSIVVNSEYGDAGFFDELYSKLYSLGFPKKGGEIWSMTDFMDWVNDEQFYPEDYFMSYITVLKSKVNNHVT